MKIISFYVLPITFLSIIVLIVSCNHDLSKDNTSAQRSKQLTNMYDNGINSLHDKLEIDCLNLFTEINTLSQNLTVTQLEMAQEKWRIATESYKRCELYNIGDVSRTFIRYRIHRWETNTEALEDSLLTNIPATSDYISSLGSAIIGLAAVEYLLFETDVNTTLTDLQSNTKRLDYLVESSNYIYQRAAALNITWDNYSAKFKSTLESKINGGQNLMLNSMIAYLEETTKVRLGKALGESNGGTLDIEQFEAFRSRHSLELIKNGFDEFKLCYRGNYSNGNGFGFDNYTIDLENQILSDRIETALQNCDDKLNALSDLNTDLINQTQKVIDLQITFQELVILLKADLASFIGATVTVNETDGD